MADHPSETPTSPPDAIAAETRLDAEAVFAAVDEAAYSWCIASDRLDWSANAAAVLGLPDATDLATATGYAAIVDPDALSTRFGAVLGSAETDTGAGVAYALEYPIRRRGGLLWVQDVGRWFAGADGRPARAIGVVRTLGGRHEGSQKAELLARFDPLTGQLSRPRLLESARAALAEAKRLQSHCALALVAIADLSEINDAYGLDVGDEVIAGISRRLRASMRGGDALGRFSTSSFGLVLRACDAPDFAVAAQRFVEAIGSAPITTSAGPVAAHIAVGGVIAPRSARSVEEMVLRARDVLAEARHAPEKPFHLYRPDSAREKRRRKNLELTDDLLTALNDRRLHLALQPVVHAGSRRTAWKEALLRVQLPDGAVISGEPLVRAAADLGLVGLVDHRVLELALHLLGLRRRARIAVNVSGSAITDPTWLDALGARLPRLPDAGRRLQVEIDERAAATDLEPTRRLVARLRGSGVRVTIDGFGAGHLSVTALRDLGAEQVKIGGAFIAGLESAPDRQTAVRALVAFARELGLSVVAGHVESAEAAALLTGWGVGYLQGSFFGALAVEAPAVRDIAV